jgi:archaellum component FlaF (FlaF/FlaG flagellin family)
MSCKYYLLVQEAMEEKYKETLKKTKTDINITIEYIVELNSEHDFVQDLNSNTPQTLCINVQIHPKPHDDAMKGGLGYICI